MEQLVIRIGSQPDAPVHWLVWSVQEKEIIASGVLDNAQRLGDLTARTGKHSAILLVPGSEVLLKEVELPGKATRKLLNAIPFMLEDELSEDIEQLFFSYGQQINKRQQMVIVKHQRMREWLSLMDDASLHCDKMLPDILCVPQHNEAWQAVQLDNELVIRQATWQGITGELPWLKGAIELHAKRLEKKLEMTFLNESGAAPLVNTNITQNIGPLPMQVLAEQAIGLKFNLMQDQYKPKKQGKSNLHQWRLAASLAVVALLTTFVDKGLQATQLKHQNAEMKTQISEEFKRAFPETRRIVNVRSQLKQKLEALENSGNGVSMLAMMSQLNQAFANSNIKPQTLRYDRSRSELRLQAIADGYDDLETFKRLAEQQGFSVEQGAINNRDNKVVGSLAIRS